MDPEKFKDQKKAAEQQKPQAQEEKPKTDQQKSELEQEKPEQEKPEAEPQKPQSEQQYHDKYTDCLGCYGYGYRGGACDSLSTGRRGRDNP